jgi:hypothetical protein
MNLFKETNSREKTLKVITEKGRFEIEALEFPDDFFLAGKYIL